MIRGFLSDLLGAACLLFMLWAALVSIDTPRPAASPDAITHE